MIQSWNVRMGEIKFSFQPGILKTAGLGSCIALIIYDYKLQYGGLAHIMLPKELSNKNDGHLRGKYANLAIPYMYDKILDQGSNEKDLWAKITGGAQMFSFEGTKNTIRIGERNIEEVRQILRKMRIPIKAQDVGGTRGRSIEFDLSTGALKIKNFETGDIII